MLKNLKFKLVLGFATLLVAGGIALQDTPSWFQLRQDTPAPSVTNQSHAQLLSELLDPRHAAVVLPKKSFQDPVIVTENQIDLTIDRRSILKSLFLEVTSGKRTDLEKIEAWVVYLQNRIAHPKHAPLLDNGQAIYDPIWMLKSRIAHCGQTNRLVADGLSANGYRTRIVQLKAHVAAEVWLDGQWRFLDADWLNLGQFVRKKDGGLASAFEIHKDPSLLDGLLPGLEFKLYPIDVLGNHPSYKEMFDTPPYYYLKTATLEQEKNVYFGWNYYTTQKGSD